MLYTEINQKKPSYYNGFVDQKRFLIVDYKIIRLIEKLVEFKSKKQKLTLTFYLPAS